MYASVLLLATLSMDLCLLALRPIWWGAAGRACRVLAAQGHAGAGPAAHCASAIYRRLIRSISRTGWSVVDYGGSTVAENSVTAPPGLFLASWRRWWSGRLPWCPPVSLPDAAGHWAWPSRRGGVFCLLGPYHALGLILTLAAPHSTLLAPGPAG